MKIARIETVITRPPIRHSGMLGVGALESVESVIVRLQTDEGIEGVGESSPWPVFAGNAFAIKETIDRYLAPAVIGRSVTDIEAILLAMDAVHYAAHFAKAGVEMAVLDAAGKALGRPVYDLLGGLVRDRVNLSYSVTNQVIEKDLDEIRWLLDQGFKVLKIKTGVLPARIEVERIAAIRALVGDAFDMRIDFNQGGKREQVLRLCRELEKYNPYVHRTAGEKLGPGRHDRVDAGPRCADYGRRERLEPGTRIPGCEIPGRGYRQHQDHEAGGDRTLQEACSYLRGGRDPLLRGRHVGIGNRHRRESPFRLLHPDRAVRQRFLHLQLPVDG